MKKFNQPQPKSLREQAEEILQLKLPIKVLPQTEAETLKLIHELQPTVQLRMHGSGD